MHKLAELCVKRPIFATVIILSLVVVGLFAYSNLGVDRFPNVDFPFVTISTRLVGAAPEEIETEITDKIEEAVNTISGIDQLISVSSEGISVVTVQFVLEKDGDVAAQEVRDRVNTILGDLPTDADPPIIEKIDPDASPVLSIVLSGNAPIRDITEFADKTLRRQIESIYGVGQVRIVGGRPRQVNVIVDTAKLASLGLTAAEVVQALQSQNVQLPGGRVEQGARDLTLRTYGRVSSPGDFALIPITTRNGYSVRVGDVAKVEDGMADPETVATFDGEPAVVLQVRKQSGTNTIEVVERLKERVDLLRTQLPAGWKMDEVRDQSEYILAAVHAVQEHLILGSFLAAGIVFLFLGKIRPTIIAAVSIPSALIATFAAMEWMGFTLNVITLLALTLAVGIVIDDAVIVLEIIFRYMEEKKMSAREAAVEGTREIGLAVIAMTLSLIAVFLPVAFMAGIVGRFMNSFGVTMAFAIAVSLLVAFTLTPMMASRWLSEEDLHQTAQGKSSRESRFYAPVERAYMGLLRWSMHHRWVVVIVMVLTVASTVPLVVIANKNFLPTDDESQFEVNVRAAEGSSLETTQVILESIGSKIRELPEVSATLLTIGDDQQRTRNLGVIYVKLLPVTERKASQFDVMARIRQDILPRYASLDLRAAVAPVSPFRAGNNAEIMFWVGGPDLDQLAQYSTKLMDVLRSEPGVVDADTNLVVGKPELGIRIDRAKAADLGVQVQDVAATMNVLVGGLEITDYYEGGEQYEVHVRADERFRKDATGIAQAEVPSRTAGRVKMKDVVRVEEGTGPSLINRIARRRQVLLSANMAPGFSSQTVIDALNQTASELNLPPGYSYGLTGRSREQGRAFFNFLIAFVLSIIFMYLILAAQFESWLHPVTILLALPMTIPFALLSIVAMNQSINIFSMLGILVLFGIVKKNGILQIDHMNGLRLQGVAREEAILHANRDRLRPILMTTLAFVAGMIPLVVSSGTGAGTNRAIGIVVIGGQTLALLLTLIGTPITYSIFDDWSGSRVLARVKGWFRIRPSSEPAEAGAAGRHYQKREA
jgi:hydrophobic/amphiphilic exporter-1 (mainly G- bacteria), HAE1 family